MRIAFFTHERHANVRDPGWVMSKIYNGLHVAAPRKEDIVHLEGKRYVVREVQWDYGDLHEDSAVASVYLWSEAW